MGYYSYVGAAIGGKPNLIRDFIASLPKDISENNIIHQFKMIVMNPHFAVFTYYSRQCKWYEEEQDAWKDLTDRAHAANLPFILCRTGENLDDYEMRESDDGNLSERHALQELFSFVHCVDAHHFINHLDAPRCINKAFKRGYSALRR